MPHCAVTASCLEFCLFFDCERGFKGIWKLVCMLIMRLLTVDFKCVNVRTLASFFSSWVSTKHVEGHLKNHSSGFILTSAASCLTLYFLLCSSINYMNILLFLPAFSLYLTCFICIVKFLNMIFQCCVVKHPWVN